MDVSLRGFGKRFQGDPVLEGIDLDLGPGQIVALIGLNGAGKTTLLRSLAGILVPSRGSIRWNRSQDLRDDRDLQRRIMFLPDTPLGIEQHTPLEHIALHLKAFWSADPEWDGVAPVGLEDRVAAVLGELDLLTCAESPMARLSRGQRYKAALAVLLLLRPELWLLDEPFASGMDPQGMFALKAHAKAAAAAGACIVYTTQIIEIAERFCDLLLVLDHGRLIDRISHDQLRAMPEDGPGSLGARLTAYRADR